MRYQTKKMVVALVLGGMVLFSAHGTFAEQKATASMDTDAQTDYDPEAAVLATQLDRALLKVEELQKKCDAPAQVAAVNRVRKMGIPYRSKPLSDKHRKEVERLTAEAISKIPKCNCDELKKLISGLDERLSKLEARVKRVETVVVNHVQQLGDHEKRIVVLENKKPSIPFSSSAFLAHESALDLYFRGFVGYQLTAPMTWRTVLNVGTIGVSLVLTRYMVRRDKSGTVESEGTLLAGLDGLFGGSLQTGSVAFYGGGAFLAGQWSNGVYLGVNVSTIVGGMTPSKYWMKVPAGVLGVNFLRKKAVGLFMEVLVGPSITTEYPIGSPKITTVDPFFGLRFGFRVLRMKN